MTNIEVKFIIAALLIFSVEQGLSQDTLRCWSKKDKLRWSDFESSVPQNQKQSVAKAISPTNIFVNSFRNEGVLKYKVKAVFFKNRAWTKDTSASLLAHEQLHFDIAELYARKIRKAIHEVSSRIKQPLSRDFKDQIEGFLLEFRKRQIEYDLGTVHGVVGKSQQEWSRKICIELEQLKEYASTEEHCNWKPKPQVKDSLKCWGSSKLRWSDFKGSLSSARVKFSAGAECSCTPKAYWVIEEDSTYTYKVKAAFNRYKSWANAKDTTEYLLAHEQLHFDISELYARKMRKAFKELGRWSESVENAYSVLIKKMYSEHIARQNEYDTKTNHGTLKQAQQEWSKKIQLELEALKVFASTAADCN
jgi:predicted secreted Zn-dependent protease